MAKPKKSTKSKNKSITLKKKPTVKLTKKIVKKPAAKRKTKVTAIPKGYHSITPYLIVDEGTKAIAFYKKVFGAKEVMRMEHSGGKIGHAELKIGDARIMLADECPEMHARSPQTIGGTPVSIHLYIKDVDSVVKRAVAAGAKLLRTVEDMFYGDRCGAVEDPYGHTWFIATHIENVTPAQVRKRAEKLFAKK